ncbi:hypothetical protein [Halosimplex sp. TS25]|uniref:hypothetical protein n=1 Tax=Halosimplex rarum TaxID=3396619 RepID=UPI0039E7E919
MASVAPLVESVSGVDHGEGDAVANRLGGRERGDERAANEATSAPRTRRRSLLGGVRR